MERSLPALIYLAYRLDPGFNRFHDDGVNQSTAHALALGDGYIHESFPVSVPQTKYLVLYPAPLSPRWLITAWSFNFAFLAKLVSYFFLAATGPCISAPVRFWMLYLLYCAPKRRIRQET